MTTELRAYNRDGTKVLSLERTPVIKRDHARPSAAQPSGWPEGVGAQPSESEEEP